MDSTIAGSAGRTAPVRSAADRRMRRLLGLPENAPRVSLVDAQKAFSRSIVISGTRCLVTYVALPVLAPIVDLSGAVGPAIGLVLGVISMVAIFFATRRFFAADHRWRWGYAAIGGAIFVFLVISVGFDIAALVT